MAEKNLEDSDNTDDSEDTSQEEDTEESDDSGTEEEEEKEETEEELEEGKEEGEEEEPEQILDLTKVPPSLKEAARRMLSTQTKTLAKLKKNYEDQVANLEKEYGERYSDAIVKAKGFDNLTNLPVFKQFWNDYENNRPYGYSSEFRNNKASNNSNDEEGSASPKLTTESILKELAPAIESIIDRKLEPMNRMSSRKIWEDAEKTLPNFSKYRAAITAKIADHPTLSIEEAYDLVSSKDREKAAASKAVKEASEAGKKIPKKTLKPGSSGSPKMVDRSTVKDINAALNLAFRESMG